MNFTVLTYFSLTFWWWKKNKRMAPITFVYWRWSKKQKILFPLLYDPARSISQPWQFENCGKSCKSYNIIRRKTFREREAYKNVHVKCLKYGFHVLKDFLHIFFYIHPYQVPLLSGLCTRWVQLVGRNYNTYKLFDLLIFGHQLTRN